MNYAAGIYAGDDALMVFNEESREMSEHFDDAFVQEETMEDENARYAGVIRELTEFESSMPTPGEA